MVSFTAQSPYYPQQENPKYAMNTGCMGPRDVPGSSEKKKKKLSTMLGIKFQFFGCATSSVVTVKFRLFQLPGLLQMQIKVCVKNFLIAFVLFSRLFKNSFMCCRHLIIRSIYINIRGRQRVALTDFLFHSVILSHFGIQIAGNGNFLGFHSSFF